MNEGYGIVAAALGLGFFAGILSGMFGIGGGLVIVPALVFLFGVPLKTATGTSLFALLWPVGLLGLIEYYNSGHLDWKKGAWIAVGLFCGALFGARITLALPTSTLKKLYAVFLLTAGVWYLWNPVDALKGKPPEAPAATETPGGQVH
jgi:uncharacterized membrane protein YfcA